MNIWSGEFYPAKNGDFYPAIDTWIGQTSSTWDLQLPPFSGYITIDLEKKGDAGRKQLQLEPDAIVASA
jgi:hypothetical protein